MKKEFILSNTKENLSDALIERIKSDPSIANVIMFKKLYASLKDVFDNRDVKDIQTSLVKESEGDKLSAYGVDLTMRSKDSYDFERAGHTLYNEVVASIEKLKKIKGELEDQMKLMMKDEDDIPMVDSISIKSIPSGQVVRVKKPVKVSSEFVYPRWQKDKKRHD